MRLTRLIDSMKSVDMIRLLSAAWDGGMAFAIILSSSLSGTLARRRAASRAGAYTAAVTLLSERAQDEAKGVAVTVHDETIAVRIEWLDG
jgi:hypothetical protein